MPWAWPAECNRHEARAYCAWRTERDAGGSQYRLLTEAEHVSIRDSSGAGSGSSANLHLSHGSSSPVDASLNEAGFGDATGNVWEWCENDFHPLDGFAPHPLYDDFSTPCFDGEHSMIMGGSWASTGDLASPYARYHFRRHFFQHAGLRLAASGEAAEGDEAEAGGSTDSRLLSYESATLLNEYVMLHFGTAADVLPFASLPASFLRFPQRCARLLDDWATRLNLRKARALDIGCAVGGSSFELARSYDEVVGVDLSASFIGAAQRMQADGALSYYRRDQGELGKQCVVRLDDISPQPPSSGRIQFQRGDACALHADGLGGGFDACLLGNLLCRLPKPAACLDSLSGLIRPGGLAVIVSP